MADACACVVGQCPAIPAGGADRRAESQLCRERVLVQPAPQMAEEIVIACGRHARIQLVWSRRVADGDRLTGTPTRIATR